MQYVCDDSCSCHQTSPWLQLTHFYTVPSVGPPLCQSLMNARMQVFHLYMRKVHSGRRTRNRLHSTDLRAPSEGTRLISTPKGESQLWASECWERNSPMLLPRLPILKAWQLVSNGPISLHTSAFSQSSSVRVFYDGASNLLYTIITIETDYYSGKRAKGRSKVPPPLLRSSSYCHSGGMLLLTTNLQLLTADAKP